MFDVVFINSTADFQKLLHNVSSLNESNEGYRLLLKFPWLLIACIFLF